MGRKEGRDREEGGREGVEEKGKEEERGKGSYVNRSGATESYSAQQSCRPTDDLFWR